MGARVVAMGLLVLLALLVKTTVTPGLVIAGARPDVLVLVVVGIALVDGPDTGLRLGFMSGLAQDLVSGGSTLVGLGALVLMAVGYIAGRVRPYLASSRKAGAVALGGTLAGGATLVYGLLGRILDVVAASVPQVTFRTLAVALYSAAVAPLVLRPVRALMKQFPSASSGVGSGV